MSRDYSGASRYGASRPQSSRHSSVPWSDLRSICRSCLPKPVARALQLLAKSGDVPANRVVRLVSRHAHFADLGAELLKRMVNNPDHRATAHYERHHGPGYCCNNLPGFHISSPSGCSPYIYDPLAQPLIFKGYSTVPVQSCPQGERAGQLFAQPRSAATSRLYISPSQREGIGS